MMRRNKSTVSKKFNWLLIVLSFIVLISFIFSNKLFSLLFWVAVVVIISTSIKIRKSELFIKTFSIFLIEGGVIFLLFRKLRSFMPPSQITQENVVGFAQYNGYPMYYDTVVFFIFIISPILICTMLYLFKKYYK